MTRFDPAERNDVLDSTRAVHGDLGMVHHQDVVLALSHSGESEEIVRLVGPLRTMAMAFVAMTSNRHSTLARAAFAPAFMRAGFRPGAGGARR